MAKKWTEEETLLALSLYLQTPFGKIHSSNPDILALAHALDRTPASVGMKMLNLAGLNPKILSSGRVGLQNYSKLDESVWTRFSSDWFILAEQTEKISLLIQKHESTSALREPKQDFKLRDPNANTTAQAFVEQRRGQDFFRKAVMANYQDRCCISGIAEPRLLVASHIIPWKDDIANRLNPENGLALSATLDKAFDKGLLTINRNLEVKISKVLLKHSNAETRGYFEPYHERRMAEPDRFNPKPEFIDWHNDFFEKQAA
ncbi:HNH endonuclease [uncultured Parasphingorhabdus sp.]|uniref:HNH endonuclease n=1 Tax=uncultured Parasphingorhabdus sp. TaxID=2709694 RepID=UPI0030D6F1E7|tara:strand:+ start:241 stop:1020 length:780 start_codon:yes stop_codon:yes gene_type:complete